MTRVTTITAKGCQSAKLADLEKLLAARKGLTWVDMAGPLPTDLRLMEEVFQFHPLAIEDTVNHQQSPKLEQYPDYLFVILNAVELEGNELRPHEVDVFVGKNYVVTVHMDDEPAIDEAYERIDREAAIAEMSSGLLLYMIMDTVIDRYFPTLDTLAQRIEKLEDEILEDPRKQHLNALFIVRRALIDLWRVVWPQREMVSALSHRNTRFMNQADLEPYLRDVFDHLLWIADMVSAFRDTTTGIMDLYMSAVSNRLNRVVNRLTLFTIIIGTLAVITGFYGMNFEQTWPPFGADWGALFVVGVISALLIGAALYIQRSEDA